MTGNLSYLSNFDPFNGQKVSPEKEMMVIDYACWIDSMQEELHLLKAQNVWNLEETIYNVHAVGTKWVLRN